MKIILTFCLSLFLLSPTLAQKNDNPAFYLKTGKKKLAVILEAANFKPGEHVADIGAGLGWFDVAIGIYEDSLSFYLEEIDSSFIKKGRLSEALLEYTTVKGRPITCTYKEVVGTTTSTHLPDTTFEKVLLIDTFHHLEFRDEMIRDMKRILKTGGKLIVCEPLADKPGEIFKPCNTLVYTSDEVISSFRARGFQLEGTYESVKSGGNKVRVFVFGKW